MTMTALALLSVATIRTGQSTSPNLISSGKPVPIREGPIGATNAVAGDPYWFQQGVEGSSSTYDSVAARVQIRTVYDSVNNDAHSYWVGTLLANGAFVQVGYLNGLTTTGQYYCCAWFFEYFPPGNNNSPPIIGSPGSAGPIGSWHTYSMNYTGNDEWSFYMDNQYLGSSPAAGQQYYLGSGDSSSGSHAVAALSEVAQTTVNTDVIGPAEFKGFQYQTLGSGWNDVDPGQVHWGYGAGSSMSLTNPYGVSEIVGVQNDFLAGSTYQFPGTNPGIDECGNVVGGNANIYPVTCAFLTTYSFSFVDENGSSITPSWIALSDSSGRQVFYSEGNYNGQGLPSPTGEWTLTQVSWHAVNVAAGQVLNTSMTSQVFSTQVFSITLAVVGYFYSLPVKTATVVLYLPDSTNQTLKTDSNGEGLFTQLPPSDYSIHITVPYGVASDQVDHITGPGSIVAKVFSLPELITIIVPPIFVAVLASILIVRKERQRQAMMRAQAPLQPPIMAPLFCRSCGQPLTLGAYFCTNCGTPVRITAQ
jgi:hypothetical protein